MKKITFEAQHTEINAIRNMIQHISNNTSTKEMAVSLLSDIVPSGYKLGHGGSHVWCSSANNERIFIITGY